jgi:hypothetical protein
MPFHLSETAATIDEDLYILNLYRVITLHVLSYIRYIAVSLVDALNFVRTTRFWNTLHQLRSLSKYWKAKYNSLILITSLRLLKLVRGQINIPPIKVLRNKSEVSTGQFVISIWATLHQYLCAQRVSEIPFISYAHYRNIGKPNNLKVFGSNNTKSLNRTAKIN